MKSCVRPGGPRLPHLPSSIHLLSITNKALHAPNRSPHPHAAADLQVSLFHITSVSHPSLTLSPVRRFATVLVPTAPTLISSLAAKFPGYKLRANCLPRSPLDSVPRPQRSLNSTSALSFQRLSFVSRYARAFGMASLSQPQSPSPLDSPLREHRNRPVERLTDSLETPSLDDRSYRVIKLPSNQLEVLLVHDADTDKASAAMDVNVGNFSDEEDMPGMAHAVEYDFIQHCMRHGWRIFIRIRG